MNVGDRVVKNSETWNWTEFETWGAGEGIGVVLEVVDEITVDVQWPAGRCYQDPKELIIVNA